MVYYVVIDTNVVISAAIKELCDIILEGGEQNKKSCYSARLL